MNQTDNKALLLEAIDNYSLYTINQKTILKTLIDIEVDGIVVASILDLKTMLKISRPSIYRALERFQADGIIETINESGNKLSALKIKQAKLNEILEHFLKKEKFLRK